MRKARKNYSPQEKMAILRRHLLDKVSILRLCAEFQLQPTVFYRWLKQFFDNGAAALRRKPTAGKQPDSRQRGIAVTQGQLAARESREAEQQWMISLTQGRFGSEQVRGAIGDSVSQEDMDKLLGCVRNEPLKYRKRAVAVLSYHRLIRVGHVAGFLGVSHSSVDDWVRRFAQHGCRLLLRFFRSKVNIVRLRTRPTGTRFLKYYTPRHRHIESTVQHGDYGIFSRLWQGGDYR